MPEESSHKTERKNSTGTTRQDILEHSKVADAIKEKLQIEQSRIDPLELLHRICEGQSALAALTSDDQGRAPAQHSLDEFLEKLPRLWHDGEVRPTHRKTHGPSRTRRTREDPFEGVWAQVLDWLQQDPDATAMYLFERLRHEYPDRFTNGQLRTLQRRIRQWRKVIAREMVHVCVDKSTCADSPVTFTAIG